MRHGINPWRRQPGREDGGEFLLGVLKLAVRLEQFDEFLAQLRQDFDVQGGVAQPGLRQRAGGPVGGRMFLGQAEAQQLFDDGGQPDARQPGQARGEFGVEQLVRPHAKLGQARKVLAGRVQDPFDAVEGIVDDAQVIEGFGIDQPGAGAFAADLDQEGALAVPEAGGALGVNARRTGAGGDGGRAALQPGLGFDDQRHAVAGCIKVDDIRGPGCRSLPPRCGVWFQQPERRLWCFPDFEGS